MQPALALHPKKLSVAVERSRSGNGAHVWLFVSAPLAAAIARWELGCYLITETMTRRHELRPSNPTIGSSPTRSRSRAAGSAT